MCQPINKEDQIKRTEKMPEEAPTNPIAKHWVRLYRSLPKINFPFTNLDISFTLFSVAFLYAVRLAGKAILVKGLDWPEHDFGTHESTGSVAAIVHSLALVPGLFVALTTQPYRPTSHLNTAPQWWQDLVSALLSFCTGYMIYDSFASYFFWKGLNLEGSDYLFIGHHIATMVYMTQCRVLQAGHTSAMICMFLGEFTNPFQNSDILISHALKLACCNGPMMLQIHKVVEFCFAFTYFSIRGIIAPIFFAHATFALLFESSRTNIPFALRILWIILIWAVEVGSYAWTVACWETLQTYVNGANVAAEL